MTNRSKIHSNPATVRDGKLPVAAMICCCVTVLICCCATALAVPQIENLYGSQSPFYLPEINGMGGTGVAMYRGALSNVLNPAMLTWEEGMRFDGGLSLDQQHEDRFQPLFDTFESYVTDVSIASNRNHYFQTGFGLSRRVLDGAHAATVAVSLADRYVYDYDFFEEVRDPDPFSSPRDRILEDRSRRVDGTLRALSAGAAMYVHERVSLGAAVHYAFGTRTDILLVRNYDVEDSNARLERAFSESGVNFTVGARVSVHERFEVGLAWESPLTVDGDVHNEYEHYDDATAGTTVDRSRVVGEIEYPQIIRGGLTFRPRTDPRTEFTADVAFMQYSEVTDNLVLGENTPAGFAEGLPTYYEDTLDVRIGVQHTFYSGVPVRFGFRHYNAYYDTEAATTVFSGGIGMPVVGGMVSASVELAKVTSIQGHQFEYPSDFVSDPDARVEDTRFRVGIGFSREF